MDDILTEEEIANLVHDSAPAALPQQPVRINMQLIRKCMSLPPSAHATAVDDDDAEVESLLAKTVLRLDWQGISKIENLDVFSHIRDLYLQHNAIQCIENLDFHVHLEFLALSHNDITEVTNVLHLTKLKFLDLSHNKIARVDVEHLPPSLEVVRFAGNPWAQADHEYQLTLFEALPRLQIVDQFRRHSSGADSPTYHGDALRQSVESQPSPFDATTSSRDAIKEQKDAMSARHADRMKQLNASLNEQKNLIVEQSMMRMRERRQKLQQQTESFMAEAASHVQALHAKHELWRKAQLDASTHAS
ncbi:hypothetical protein H310_08117 [Aphanomyces invadans]|uniref:U2A'/phosphoprotein 32 family A C-terminal domain-containing protein n=1 Tax=Aphanomyces invadans TaxID=157072 RepID=A0A024TZL3_9STRA|nr:hypothetical protein H310_08117 [Aphanomyces invadans]ETV99423.1 hypothetical protein H310_08117 [Aphanomyces invadans]|eukprot:XP_008871979.1 hypothetical protein H310_08117 [Aphanomyces invadans]